MRTTKKLLTEDLHITIQLGKCHEVIKTGPFKYQPPFENIMLNNVSKLYPNLLYLKKEWLVSGKIQYLSGSMD